MSIALRKKMHQDLQLAGLSEGTQDVYLRAVRQLAVHFHRRRTSSMKRKSATTCFTSRTTESLPPARWASPTAPSSSSTPTPRPRLAHSPANPRSEGEKATHVLSIDEVRELIGAVRKLRYRTYFSTVYSLGLRRTKVSTYRSPTLTVHGCWCTSIVARAPRTASCHCLPAL